MFKLFCPVNGFENKIFKDFSQFILMLKSEHPSVAPICHPGIMICTKLILYTQPEDASIQVSFFSNPTMFQLTNNPRPLQR